MRGTVRHLLVAVLLVLLVSTVSARPPVSLYGGIGYGKLLEDGAPGGSVGLETGLIYRVPANPSIGIGAGLGYVMLGKEEGSVEFGKGAGMSAEVSVSVIPVTAQLYYIVPTQSSFGGYLDGGAGFYNTRSKWDASAELEGYGSYSNSGSESSTDFGVNFGGGLKFGGTNRKMSFGADAKYHIIMTDGGSSNLVTVFGRLYFN